MKEQGCPSSSESGCEMRFAMTSESTETEASAASTPEDASLTPPSGISQLMQKCNPIELNQCKKV